jgi:hypothetical protein
VPGQHEVAAQPVPARHEGREAHPDVQRDTRLLGQHFDRAEPGHRGQHPVEGRAHGRVRAREMPVQVTRGAQACDWFRLAKVRPHCGHAHIAAATPSSRAVTARGLVPVEQREDAKVFRAAGRLLGPDHVS